MLGAPVTLSGKAVTGVGIKSQGNSGPQYLQPGDHGGPIPSSKGQALAAGLFQKFVPGDRGLVGQGLSGAETPPSHPGWAPFPQSPSEARFCLSVEHFMNLPGILAHRPCQSSLDRSSVNIWAAKLSPQSTFYENRKLGRRF